MARKLKHCVFPLLLSGKKKNNQRKELSLTNQTRQAECSRLVIIQGEMLFLKSGNYKLLFSIFFLFEKKNPVSTTTPMGRVTNTLQLRFCVSNYVFLKEKEKESNCLQFIGF